MTGEPHRKHILLRIEALLILLLLFFSCLIILSLSILPSHGIHVCWNVTGDSMEPTIKEGALIFSRHTPYDELDVGDIIVFKRRLLVASTNGTAEATAKYLDNTITHRIVSIEEDGIHTRGDNNQADDQYPVTVDGYVAKVVWWNNYAGWLFWFMFELGGFYWLIGAVVVNGVVVLWLHESRRRMPR